MLAASLPTVPAAAAPVLNATDYGVVADGKTADNAALGKALAACAGGSLFLPVGQILLSGSESLKLSGCHLIGADVAASETLANGTTILLTGKAAPPFTVGSDWAISGVSFYWPQQIDGTTPYPSLFADDGTHDANHWRLHHVNIINAYDGFVATGARSWGAWIISDSYLYAVHDLFRIGVIADTGQVNNVQLEPGAWLGLCHFACAAAVNAADRNNTIFHATGSDAIKAAGNVDAVLFANVAAVGWRYGLKIDKQGAINNSKIELIGDGIATFVDTAEGGSTEGTIISCPGGCVSNFPAFGNERDTTSNHPAFNLGREGRLILHDFALGGGRGSFIVSAGASVSLDNVRADAYGAAADGRDYYAIDITGNNGTQLTVRNSDFSARASANNHGIRKRVPIPTTQIQNNKFAYLNDALDLTADDGAPIIITGNQVGETYGPASLLIRGGGPVLYDNNAMDKPPAARVTGCGAGANATGSITGFITVGTANGPVRYCQLTLPWTPAGGGAGNCIFVSANGFPLAAGARGSPPTWTITAAADLASTQIRYSCRGAQ